MKLENTVLRRLQNMQDWSFYLKNILEITRSKSFEQKKDK